MQATNFYKSLPPKNSCTQTVGWQKFVQYIRMLYLGCFILVGIVSQHQLCIQGTCSNVEQNEHREIVRHYKEFLSSKTLHTIALGRCLSFERCESHLVHLYSNSVPVLYVENSVHNYKEIGKLYLKMHKRQARRFGLQITLENSSSSCFDKLSTYRKSQ